jgi:hypothetical protein
LESIEHYNVLICTPGRSMEAEYVQSLTDTIAHLQKNGISYKYSTQYSSQVDAARESTIMGSTFLDIFNNKPLLGQATYDKIFWIDSDMSWTIDDFLKLYLSDKDIISGLYVSHEGVPMFSPLQKNSHIDTRFVFNENEIFEISAAGFGFICIKNGIFESMKRPWFETKFQFLESDDGRISLVPLGEDYSWCKSATELGYKIFLDPTVKLVHHKKMALKI